MLVSEKQQNIVNFRESVVFTKQIEYWHFGKINRCF